MSVPVPTPLAGPDRADTLVPVPAPSAPASPGLSLLLPRSRALTDAVLAPTGPAVATAELDRVRGIVAAALASGVAGRGAPLNLDGYQVDLARLDPSRCRPRQPFTPSPGRCRRAIGLEAVRRALRSSRGSPVTAVGEILSEATSDPVEDQGSSTSWWSQWYRGLSVGARAVVQAEAVTWATALWTALDWDRFDRLDVGGGNLRWTAPPQDRSVGLRARADVRTWVGDAPVLVLVGSGTIPLQWRPTLGYPALVAALAHDQRAVPRRVVSWWPAAGQVRITEVDGPLLEETATAVLAAVAVWGEVDA
jgi:hypothetical protein